MFNLRQGLFAAKQATRSFSSSAARSNVAKMTLVGRVGTDISELTSAAGRRYIKYALAVNTSKEHTSWFNIAVFDDNAINFMTNYVTKGYVPTQRVVLLNCSLFANSTETSSMSRPTPPSSSTKSRASAPPQLAWSNVSKLFDASSIASHLTSN